MSDQNEMRSYVAKTFAGLEEVLSQELKDLGAKNVQPGRRAVTFECPMADIGRYHLWLRTALSVLECISEFKLHGPKEIYTRAKRISWEKWFDLHHTFAISSTVQSDMYKHSNMPALLVKDGIVDRFRQKMGKRPFVERKNPDVQLEVQVHDQRARILVNLSGAPLFRRGYREETGPAPLNEVMAAGLVLLSGWDKKQPLLDPFCGSGTIAIEAAMIAANIPPNIQREGFSFQNLKPYGPEVWTKAKREVRIKPYRGEAFIHGSDILPEMIAACKNNVRNLPIREMITWTTQDFFKLKPTVPKPIIICNPPYGERLEFIENGDYEKMANYLKRHLAPVDFWMITSNMEGLKEFSLKHDKTMNLLNGNIPCKFRYYDIFPLKDQENG